MAQQTTMAAQHYEPEAMSQRRLRLKRRIAVLVVVLALLLGTALTLWYKLFREVPTYFADDADHFKYGSIGNEANGGVPYWIWLALPRVFPEHLPGDGGYASLGMVFEPGEWKGNQWVGGEVPVGFSKKTIGFPRVAMNCALCHLTVVRKPGEASPTLIPSGPSNQLDAQGYIRFLSQCAHDDRFTADILLEEMSYDVRMGPLDKFLYRYFIIPQTRQGLLELEKQYAWMATKPDWGRGRIDPFNPVKVNVLKMPPDDTIGNADMPPIWNLKAHAGYAFHWDGMNSHLQDIVLSSAIGDGATRDSIDLAGMKRVQSYLESIAAPKYPFPIDSGKADKGRGVYTQKCAECHAFGGARTGKIATVTEVGTDGERHRLWTDEAARRYNAFAAGYSWKFDGFHGTDGTDGGYVNVPLDGIWARAPYLHNGSVPALRDLLKPPKDRPQVFWRGYDLFDPQQVGFDGSSAEAKRVGTRFDTNEKGNGNGGHIYGTELSEEQKDALVEYLKTL
jgi:mono/diheme cytochrome c family protein